MNDNSPVLLEIIRLLKSIDIQMGVLCEEMADVNLKGENWGE